MKEITGGVTAAKGFQAASTAAGIKYKDRKDMAMIYSEVPCKAAGTFTTNIVKAAPVKWDHNVVYNSKAAQAVVINAGIANACTGEEGMGYCRQTAEKVEKVLGIAADEVLVASTGVIGMQLPIDRICNGIDAMVLEYDDVELVFQPEALDAVADQAIQRNIGARGLRAVMEGLLTRSMYEIPSDPTITRVTITPEAVLKTGEPEITRDPQRTERPGRTRDGKAEHDPSAPAS